jgi:hypothetical protein
VTGGQDERYMKRENEKGKIEAKEGETGRNREGNTEKSKY